MPPHVSHPPAIITPRRVQHVICASCKHPAHFRITRHDGTEGTTACPRHVDHWYRILTWPRVRGLPPMQPPREDAGSGLDWDRPAGYSHAASILARR